MIEKKHFKIKEIFLNYMRIQIKDILQKEVKIHIKDIHQIDKVFKI